MGNGLKDITARYICRGCGSTKLTTFCDLGVQPLANAFLHREDLGLPEFTAPLKAQVCAQCGLSQLTHVVAPERLYSHYLYYSGVSQGWREHCDRLAAELLQLYSRPFVVDIASNDGSLLVPFKQRGARVLGIEPAQNITQTVQVPTLPVFWNSDTAKRVREANGPADVITATNVFGHVDDIHDFLEGVRFALARDGTFIIEAPHVLSLLWLNAFDTIYHEHISYWSLLPLKQAAKQHGLAVFDVKKQSVHGGTMRYYLCHDGRRWERHSVLDLANREWEELTPALYQEFKTTVSALIGDLKATVATENLFGFGASAKGNTLLNAVGVPLVSIFDDCPAKQGLFTPGLHIPVEAPKDLSTVPKLMLLSWNWSADLKKRAKALGFKGEFLTPIPSPRWERSQ